MNCVITPSTWPLSFAAPLRPRDTSTRVAISAPPAEVDVPCTLTVLPSASVPTIVAALKSMDWPPMLKVFATESSDFTVPRTSKNYRARGSRLHTAGDDRAGCIREAAHLHDRTVL